MAFLNSIEFLAFGGGFWHVYWLSWESWAGGLEIGTITVDPDESPKEEIRACQGWWGFERQKCRHVL